MEEGGIKARNNRQMNCVNFIDSSAFKFCGGSLQKWERKKKKYIQIELDMAKAGGDMHPAPCEIIYELHY